MEAGIQGEEGGGVRARASKVTPVKGLQFVSSARNVCMHAFPITPLRIRPSWRGQDKEERVHTSKYLLALALRAG